MVPFIELGNTEVKALKQGRILLLLSHLIFTINSSLHFSQGLQANSPNCLEEFCKNSLLNRLVKICKAMTAYERFTELRRDPRWRSR